ncbi:MAG: hypothetical protein QW409_02740 [Candidatus Aenigmatarchaeota archaeon]
MSKKEKIREVILPKWVFWINFAIILIVLSLILYINSIVPEKEKLDLISLVLIITIFFIIIIMLYLSAYRGLPLYYLKEKK